MSDETFIKSNIKKALEAENLSVDDRLKLIARFERPNVDALQGVLDKINGALAAFDSRLKNLETVGLKRLAPREPQIPNLEGIKRLG